MSAVQIFKHTSYKPILKAYLRGRESRGALSRASEALGCQRSYLSRVTNAELHLTRDQAYLMAEHLKLNELEHEYFVALVDYERAADRRYREYVHRKLLALRKRHDSIAEQVNRPKPNLASGSELLYFSNPLWSAIHFLTSSPHYQTETQLCDKLGLSKESLSYYLSQLQAQGMIKKVGGDTNAKWEYRGGEAHLPNDSPLVAQMHLNWRMRAIQDAQLMKDESLHYSNFQMATQKDIETVRELAMEFIGKCKRVLDPAPSEEGVVITCDVFKL